MTNDINIGDKVRSFDFPTHRDIDAPDACFIEGIVEGFTKVEGCMRFDIKATRVVFDGVERDFEEGERAFPPLNGTPTNMGRITDGVVKVEKPNPANRIADMDVSNLTEDQLDAIRTLALAAEEHFDRLGAASEFAPKADRANRASIQAFILIGRIRKEKENRTEAA
jgi:hypothetical protein|tara:strand:+ start:889 stop:1389 length:501 start_codon:yes stop_codon:yes gene_type:complete